MLANEYNNGINVNSLNQRLGPYSIIKNKFSFLYRFHGLYFLKTSFYLGECIIAREQNKTNPKVQFSLKRGTARHYSQKAINDFNTYKGTIKMLYLRTVYDIIYAIEFNTPRNGSHRLRNL